MYMYMYNTYVFEYTCVSPAHTRVLGHMKYIGIFIYSQYLKGQIGILDCEVSNCCWKKSVWIQERLKTQSGEESSSPGRFNPVGPLQQSGCLGSYPP